MTATGKRSPAKVAKAAPAKHAAKKHAAKHAAKKHAAKKHAAKKHAAKKQASHLAHTVKDDHAEHSSGAELAKAFHHLHRAGAIISLLETDTGQDLRKMLEDGIALYKRAAEHGEDADIARYAAGLLRAAEHLGMAGLYAARGGYRVQVDAPPRVLIERHLADVQQKLATLDEPERSNGRRLLAMARELMRRAATAGDPHLEYELTMAADGLCTALEHGV